MEIDFYLCILCASPITLDTFKGTYSVWSSYSGKQRYLENIKEGFVRSSADLHQAFLCGNTKTRKADDPYPPRVYGFWFLGVCHSLLVGCLETERPLALW